MRSIIYILHKLLHPFNKCFKHIHSFLITVLPSSECPCCQAQRAPPGLLLAAEACHPALASEEYLWRSFTWNRLHYINITLTLHCITLEMHYIALHITLHYAVLPSCHAQLHLVGISRPSNSVNHGWLCNGPASARTWTDNSDNSNL